MRLSFDFALKPWIRAVATALTSANEPSLMLFTAAPVVPRAMSPMTQVNNTMPVAATTAGFTRRRKRRASQTWANTSPTSTPRPATARMAIGQTPI